MRHFVIIRIPHPFDSVPEKVKTAFDGVGFKGIHGESFDPMPGSRIYQGKKLVSFEVMATQTEMQALLDTHGLGNFQIVAYRTEELLPDPASTPENPLPNRPDYSRKPSKASLIDWMNDEYVGDPPVAQRPTELRLNYVAGTGNWEVVP